MFDEKIVAVMNKSVAPERAMNALAHICLGFTFKDQDNGKLKFMDYESKDGYKYSNISKMPFIILKASANKVKELVEKARNENIKFSTFTETMTKGGWKEQEVSTRKIEEKDHNFFGIVLLGEHQKIHNMTKKFSLWKP